VERACLSSVQVWSVAAQAQHNVSTDTMNARKTTFYDVPNVFYNPSDVIKLPHADSMCSSYDVGPQSTLHLTARLVLLCSHHEPLRRRAEFKHTPCCFCRKKGFTVVCHFADSETQAPLASSPDYTYDKRRKGSPKLKAPAVLVVVMRLTVLRCTRGEGCGSGV